MESTYTRTVNRHDMLKLSLLSAVVMLLWALCYPLIALTLPYAPVMSTAALRAAIAGLILVGVAKLLQRPFPAGLHNWLMLAMIGLSATSVGFWGMFFAGSLLSPGLATVLTNTQPLIASLLGWHFLNEHLNARAILGVALGFTGVLLISSESLLAPGGTALHGVLYTLAAAAGIAVSNILLKRIIEGVDILYAMGFQLLIGAVPLALFSAYGNEFPALELNFIYLSVVFVLATLGTIVPFVLWSWLLRRAPLYQLNVYSFLTPGFGLLAGYWFFAESLTPLRWAGVLTIIAGIYLTSVAERKTRQGSHSTRGRSKKSNGENSAERRS